MKLTRLDAIALALVVAVPLVAYVGWFRGSLAELSQSNAEEAELRQQTVDADRTAADVLLLRGRIHKMSERLEALSGSVATENDALKALDAVLGHAKDAGITIELVRPGKPTEGRTLSCLPLELTASAAFPKLYDFLSRLEHDVTLITVDKMELESDPLSEKCAIRLEIKVYFAAPDKEKKT